MRSSVLFDGQTLRTRIGSRWLPGLVEAVCKEPNSYSVRLVDGRFFRRTRWAINNVQAPTESTANSTQVRSLRFPEVHTEVLSSAEAHQQTGVELVTLAPPLTPRTKSSLTSTAPAGSTGVGEAIVIPSEAMSSSTAVQLTQQFEIPSSIGGPVSSRDCKSVLRIVLAYSVVFLVFSFSLISPYKPPSSLSRSVCSQFVVFVLANFSTCSCCYPKGYWSKLQWAPSVLVTLHRWLY